VGVMSKRKAYKLGSRSRKRLEGVHPDLVRVVERAISLTPLDFTVLEGLRTLERQKQLKAQGATRTLNSRHLTGHAVDLAPFVDGEVRWDWPLYHRLAKFVKQAAAELGVPIEWGGNWRSFKDGPHWQLPWKDYP
jgi:peptidoglycan L-alanyl-D-glutamate endopeptidase CwlK